MAVKVYGVPLSLSAAEWSRLWSAAMVALGDESVISGGVVTSAGTRTVTAAAVETYQVGTRLVSDAAVTLPQLDAATVNPRIDLICAQVSWPASDTTDGTLTSGSLVVVKGSAGANPSQPAPARNKGVLWQVPLAAVKVNTNGTISITDVRPLTGNTSAAITWSGSFTQAVTVRAKSGIAFLGGSFDWTGSTTLQPGDDKIQTVIIPAGFRPFATTWVDCHTGVFSASPVTHRLRIQPDGTGDLYVGAGTIPPNTTIRLVDASWLIGA